MQESCSCSAIDHLRCSSFWLPPQALGAGNVALSRNPEFRKEFYCEFVIRAPDREARILLMVNSLGIPDTEGCKGGMLKIYDGTIGAIQLQLAGRLLYTVKHILLIYKDHHWDEENVFLNTFFIQVAFICSFNNMESIPLRTSKMSL